MKAVLRYRATIATGALVLLALWEIGVLVSARQSAPRDEDWRRAAAVVRASFEKGALIVFAPRWVDPVGRRWLGDLIPIDDAARMDTARYRQIWEMSIRGAAAPEVVGEDPLYDETFGKVRVRRFVRQAPTVTWDLRKQSRLHEVNYEPRKCVLLRVRRASKPKRLSIPAANLGTELHVYAGIADYQARRINRATALLKVLVDGEEVTRARIDNESGWFQLPVAATIQGIHRVDVMAAVAHWKGRIRLDVCIAAEGRKVP